MAEAERRSRHAALIALALAVLAAAGGASAQEDDGFGEPWRWITFAEDSGLPSDRILDVVETPAGVPWAATTSGVAWYDGHAWIPVAASDDPNADAPHDLSPWGRDGVVTVAGGQAVILTAEHREALDLTVGGKPHDAGVAAQIDGGDAIVIGSDPGNGPSLVLRVASNGSVSFVPGAPPKAHEMIAPGDGSVVIASGVGAHRFAHEQWTELFPQGDWYGISAARATRDGLLVSFYAPLARRGTWRFRDGAEPERLGEPAIALCALASGDALAAFESGPVARIDAAGVHEIRADMLRAVSAIACRANGDTWFGSDRGLRLHRSASCLWTTWRFPGSDPRNHVVAILPRKDGSTWLATDGGVVVRKPDGSLESIAELGGQPLRQVTGIGEDASGRVLIGSGASWDGLWRFDGAWKHVGEAEGFPGKRVHAIRSVRDGRTFALCLPVGPWGTRIDGSAVYLVDGDAFVPWGKEHGLGVDRAYDVAEGPDDTLWFATSAGLVRVAKDGAATTFSQAQGLPFGRAFCVAVGPDGRAWAGAQEKGLGIVGPGDRVESLDARAGLVDDEVWGIAFDDRGRAWIATSRGLGVVGSDGSRSFRSESGLGITRTWGLAVQEDRVLVGTLGAGVSVLDLGALDVAAPRVRIASPIVEHDRALLRWTALASWGDPPPREVETRMRIDDGSWSSWTTRREEMLRSLRPGAHSVRVEARAPLSTEPASSAEAEFAIAPPSWQQAAFLSVASSALVLAACLAALAWTKARRERRALRASEERYRRLVENATEVVFALDAEARIAWSNSAGAALLGRKVGELTGHDVLETVAPESREGARAALARVRRTGQVETLELVANTADGRRRVAEVSIGPGAAGGWQGIARDVTDRRMRDEERSRAQRLESLGLLAGGVAHDINNVLAGVVGHAQLALIEMPADAPGRKRIERIESEALRGAELASRMLDYAGRGQLVMAPLDLAETVRRAVTLTETSLPARATVIVEAEPDLPPFMGDGTQLQRVVDNLLRNAAEATPRGEAEIRVAVRRVPSVASVRGSWAGVPPRAGALLVCVQDSGQGMDDETRARAFDPFFSTRKDGRGLGLAATLGIVRGHGGAIAVESAPGEGATFTVALPIPGPGQL